MKMNYLRREDFVPHGQAAPSTDARIVDLVPLLNDNGSVALRTELGRQGGAGRAQNEEGRRERIHDSVNVPSISE